MSSYRRHFDESSESSSESVYHEKNLRTKINSYEERITTNFDTDKIPKEGF